MPLKIFGKIFLSNALLFFYHVYVILDVTHMHIDIQVADTRYNACPTFYNARED